MKYIIFRKKGNEIRQHFVYFGAVGEVELVNSDEGELFWIDKDNMLDLHMPQTIKFLMKHYFENDGKEGLNVGVVTMGDDDEPRIQWSTMMDPLVF